MRTPSLLFELLSVLFCPLKLGPQAGILALELELAAFERQTFCPQERDCSVQFCICPVYSHAVVSQPCACVVTSINIAARVRSLVELAVLVDDLLVLSEVFLLDCMCVYVVQSVSSVSLATLHGLPRCLGSINTRTHNCRTPRKLD